MSDRELTVISELAVEVRKLRELVESQKPKPIVNGRVGVMLDRLRFNPATVASIVVATWVICVQFNRITDGLWTVGHMREWVHRTEQRSPGWNGADPDWVKREVDR